MASLFYWCARQAGGPHLRRSVRRKCGVSRTNRYVNRVPAQASFVWAGLLFFLLLLFLLVNCESSETLLRASMLEVSS